MKHGPGRWLPWLVGCAAVAALIAAMTDRSDPRELLQVAGRARPWWLLAALALQAATYVWNAGIWLTVTEAGGAPLGLAAALQLSVAKQFVDEALPSAGFSGRLVMVGALEKRGIPGAVVRAGVVVDTITCWAMYAVGIAAALSISRLRHQSIRVLLPAAMAFCVGTLAASAMLFVSAGRPAGGVILRLTRFKPVRRALELMERADAALVRDARVLLASCLCQVAILLLDAATVGVLIRALGGAVQPGPIFASFMISTVFRVVGVLPGGLGTFEAASVMTLKLSGLPLPIALDATLLFRVASFWLPMVPGFYFARRSARR